MLIKNIRLYSYSTDANGRIGNVFIDEKNGQFVILSDSEGSPSIGSGISMRSFADAQDDNVDAQGKLSLMPGWLDAHVHGFGGPDFSEATQENLPIITKALGETGLSYCMATLVSLQLDKLKQALSAIDHYVQHHNHTPGSTQIVGVHIEGPFIAKNCKGAHDESVLLPKIDVDIFKEILNAAPHITQWKITLAPDLEGAIDFIHDIQNQNLKNHSIKIFIGHTNASEEKIVAAVNAGATGFTHLGNANQEQVHRCAGFHINDIKSNVVRWAVHNAKQHNCYVELIVDGEHLSQQFVNFIQEKIGDKILLVTDALGPSGLQDGEYHLGALPVLKKDKKFSLKSDPEKLAGSASSLRQVVEKYSEWHENPNDLIDQIYLATVVNPRASSLHASVKLPDEKNFVVVDGRGKLVLSCCNGKVIKHISLSRPSFASP